MYSQAAGEKSVAVCNLYNILFGNTRHGQRTGNHFAPELQVVFGIPNHSRLTGSATGGMQTNDLILWNGK
ncbi:hypothetical protein SDC9_176234 [bioreactor metagenome]|uniref:Uncharacterized protein n=1 Tax=bioreactor metagenome TaxID=1076179 RepID=A0A645GSJ8_9ZZZZ